MATDAGTDLEPDAIEDDEPDTDQSGDEAAPEDEDEDEDHAAASHGAVAIINMGARHGISSVRAADFIAQSGVLLRYT
jgi:hypothetical protein